MDLGTQNEAVQKGGISIKITDGKEVVGQAKQEVDLKTGKVDVWVPITKEVSDPGIEIVVTDKQNGILDQYPVKIETGGDEGSEKKQSSASWQIIGGSIFAGLAVVIAVIIFFMKRKKSAAGIMIFIFVSAGLFLSGAGIAKAEERIVGSWQEISSSNVVFKPVAPSPKSIYYLDGLVGFEGGIDSESFENSQFEFFIGDLNDPILKTENGIKMIDIEATRAKGYKIESLGTTTGYTKGGELRYKKFPKIPINDSYLGRARFYVQFKGDRVYKGSEVIWLKDSWQWEVAFVEATVQKSTEGGLYIDFGAGTVSAQKGETVNYNISLENSAACNAFSIDVMMIIDRSGSMDGKPLADAKDAANKFVKMLNPATDQIGLVAYDTISSLSSPLTENFSSVEDAINSITVADSTCISCGIGTANKELDERKRAEAVQYEVLMTDGQANTCISSCPSGVFQEAINEAKISGAKIFTVGFGPDSAGMPPKNCGNVLDSSCALLNIIASNTGGTYSYATNGEELSEIYKAIAGSMIGQSFGTKVTVEIPDEYFSLKKDGLDKRCNFDGKSLVCNIGFLDCLDKQAPVDPIEFQVEVKADAPDGDVITKAIISNQINQEKAISFKLKISSNKPDAKFSCDPSGCDIDGCSSPDCCRCYNDKNAVLKLINKST